MLLRGTANLLYKEHAILRVTESTSDVMCANEDEERLFAVPCNEEKPHQTRKTITYFSSRYQRNGGPRPNQACVLTICIALFSVLLTMTTAVKIHAESPVIVLLPAPEAVLTCSVAYTEEERNHPVVIMWEEDHRDGPPVIWRQSDGRDFPALKYNNTVKFGDGCSLVINNPNITHSGIYTVTVDVLSEVSESVKVFVFNTTNFTFEPTLSTSTATDTLGRVRSGHDFMALTWVVVGVLCGAVLGLVMPVLHRYWCHLRKRRRSHKTKLVESHLEEYSSCRMEDPDDDPSTALQATTGNIVETIQKWRPEKETVEVKQQQNLSGLDADERDTNDPTLVDKCI